VVWSAQLYPVEIDMKYLVRTMIAMAALLLCASAQAHRITPAHSGSWFDPDFDKQGFVLEVLGKAHDEGPERTVLVYWFTFDNEGNPIWLAGVGETDKNLLLVTVQRTSGGARPPEMVNASDMQDWATVTFEFDNCRGATADFEILDDGSTGTYHLVRLTKIGDSDCRDDNDDEGDDEGEVKLEVELIASVDFPDATGKASFKQEENKSSFKVEIKNLEVGDYTLFVGGDERGTIVVKPHGDSGHSTRGKISFSDSGEGEDDDHPLDFDPRGMAIRVDNSDGAAVLSADFPQ